MTLLPGRPSAFSPATSTPLNPSPDRPPMPVTSGQMAGGVGVDNAAASASTPSVAVRLRIGVTINR